MTAAAVTFFLIFVRVSALLSSVPGFSARGVPRHVPILGGVVLAAIIAPNAPMTTPPAHLGALAVAVVGEAVLGLMAGLCVHVVFSAMASACDLVSQQIGLGLGGTLDPFLEHSDSPLGILGSWMTVLGFFGSGLHHTCLEAVAESVFAVPPGTVTHLAIDELPRAIGSAYALAISLAAPVVAFTLTINTFVAVLGRLAPRMNAFFAIGTTVTAITGTLMFVEALPWVTSVHQAALAESVRALPGLWGR